MLRARRALSLAEVLIASVVALVGLGGIVGLHVFQSRQDADIDSRLLALGAARGAMERLLAGPFDRLVAGHVAVAVAPYEMPPALGGGLADEDFRRLPGATLTYSVSAWTGERGPAPGSLEVEVNARWLEAGSPRSLKLVSARTAAREAESP